MTVKQVIVGSLIGTTVIGLAWMKVRVDASKDTLVSLKTVPVVKASAGHSKLG